MRTGDRNLPRKMQAAVALTGGLGVVGVLAANAAEPSGAALLFAVPFLIYYVAVRSQVLAGICGVFLLVTNGSGLHSVYTSESSTAAIALLYVLVWSYAAVLICAVIQSGLSLFKTTRGVRRELPWNQPVL